MEKVEKVEELAKKSLELGKNIQAGALLKEVSYLQEINQLYEEKIILIDELENQAIDYMHTLESFKILLNKLKEEDPIDSINQKINEMKELLNSQLYDSRQKKLLDKNDMFKIYGLSERTLETLRSRKINKIPYTIIGNNAQYPQLAVDKYIIEHRADLDILQRDEALKKLEDN